MVFSNLLVLLCLPNLGGKHPCIQGYYNDETEHCQLFRRPKMYVPKRKYIPIDDFNIEAVIVYEDLMKQGRIDLPWDALAAYTAPWDPKELYVQKHSNMPYPYELIPKHEIESPPLGNIPLRHIFMPEEEKDEIKAHVNKTKFLERNKSLYSYFTNGWLLYISILFELTAVLLTKTIKPSTKEHYLNDNCRIGFDGRKLLKAKRKLLEVKC